MKEQIQNRTKQLALAIIKLVEQLPNNRVGWTFTDQIVRSSTSVAANYRAVCRARSDKEFIAKMGIVIEEADETLFWLEMIEESGVIDDLRIESEDLGVKSDDLRVKNDDLGVKSDDLIHEKSEIRNQKSTIRNHKSKIINPHSEIINLKKETNELVSIFVASVKTVKKRLNQ